MALYLENLAIAGFRSFGRKPQKLETFAKVTLLIGRNNCGKSNIIRFISEVYPLFAAAKPFRLGYLDAHMPTQPAVAIGQIIPTRKEQNGDVVISETHHSLSRVQGEGVKRACARLLGRIINSKREIDGTSHPWSLLSNTPIADEDDSWKRAIQQIDHSELRQLWNNLTGYSGGAREEHWEPEILALLKAKVPAISVQVIPAIRRIGIESTAEQGHDGSGIVTRLSQLQNPTVEKQSDRQRFLAIRDFLREVTDSQDAEIEIPHDRQTIVVHMNGKALPIESMGTGVHEVIILAAAATVYTNCVMCIEEPELHLNPLLQRKLLRYLSDKTENQYIISTHSAAIMDTPNAEVYHVRLVDGCSEIERITSDMSRSTVCQDLGYHPSDLMQANCLVWVEGPSDRIYLNHWLAGVAPDIVEGIHYSVMFYGGKLASHLSFEPDEEAVKELISLRRLNRRSAILIDSDRAGPFDEINATKARLQQEFDKGPGHAWITAGREIENYISQDRLRAALLQLIPDASPATSMSPYQNCLKVKRSTGKQLQAPKVRVAHLVTASSACDLSRLDLQFQVDKLVRFIRGSNPPMDA